MSGASSKQKLVENEVVFRGLNKRALSYINELDKIADTDKNKEYLRYDDKPLHFYCECSDENCHERISIRPSQVTKIHSNNSRFVILPGHEVGSIENVIKKTKRYYEVEKFITPPKSAPRLHKTDVDNASA